jgi:hypothetical protein
LAFYKGFLPNFARLGSWNVIMFLTLEQVNEKLKREWKYLSMLNPILTHCLLILSGSKAVCEESDKLKIEFLQSGGVQLTHRVFLL